MKVKVSNERLVKDAQKLGEISQKQFPVKVSYAISKNIAHIESELKIYNKERQKLVDKYAEKDESGQIKANESGQIIFKEGCKEQWDKDIKELLAIENEFEMHTFKFDLLNGYNMSASEFQAIDYMIEE